MMKQAYERVFTDWGYEYVKVELLQECKRIYKRGNVYELQKVRKKFLGLITYTKWVNKIDIKIHPAETVDYYTCDCGEEG
jgi:hypothetical protein